MVRPRNRGMTIIELVVAMAVFSVFMVILALIAADFASLERGVRFRWFLHPDDAAVIARLRRDVLDSTGYPVDHAGELQSARYLILSVGPGKVVTWKFTPTSAVRSEWTGSAKQGEWTANATRDFSIGAWSTPNDETAVRVSGRSSDGSLVIDQIFVPRPD
ncbi:MAG: prepilin-type N-terminal cleavage/methylation domain-containing protein [Thermoanaerobaculia bacterium]